MDATVQSCGWEEREPWGSNIPQISPQGDGMYMMTGLPVSQMNQQNEEYSTKDLCSGSLTKCCPCPRQCPQLLSGRMAWETPGEGSDRQYRLRKCPYLWMLAYDVNEKNKVFALHKASHLHPRVIRKARSDSFLSWQRATVHFTQELKWSNSHSQVKGKAWGWSRCSWMKAADRPARSPLQERPCLFPGSKVQSQSPAANSRVKTRSLYKQPFWKEAQPNVTLSRWLKVTAISGAFLSVAVLRSPAFILLLLLLLYVCWVMLCDSIFSSLTRDRILAHALEAQNLNHPGKSPIL